MKPIPILRNGTARPELQGGKFPRVMVAYRGCVWLCVLLVFLTSFVAVAHFHPGNSESAEERIFPSGEAVQEAKTGNGT